MKEKVINLRWVLQHMTPVQKIGIVLFAIVSSFEGVINGFFLGGIARLKNYSSTEITRFLLFGAGAYFITYFGSFLFNFTITHAEKDLNTGLRELLVNGYLNQSTNEQNSNEVIAKITSSAKEIDNNYFMPLFQVVQVIATTISSTIFILSTNFILGIIYILFSCLTMFPALVGQKKIAGLAQNWQTVNGRMVQIIEDVLSGKTIIQNFFAERKLGNYANKAIKEESESYQKYSAFNYFLRFISWIISVLGLILPVALGLFMVSRNLFGVTVGIVVTLALTADNVVGGVRQLSGLQNVIKSTHQLRIVPEPEVVDSKEFKVVKGEDLEVNGVSFARKNKTILDNVSVRFQPQDKVLISGASGVGKTTFLQLIMGNLQPDKGTVTMGNQAINRSEYAYIPQEAWVFDGTVRDNLSLFDPFSEEELMKVIDETGLNDLGSNPLDYDCGPSGSNLSGGQKQRLTIARALLRNRELLFMDEITASLDKENSKQIRDLLYGSSNRVIEIAHHFNEEAIKKYNIKHFVLEDGKLQ